MTDRKGGPLGLRWTYLRPYGADDQYSVDLYRPYDGADNVEFVRADEGVPEYAVGEYSLNLGRKDLDELIEELLWLRENWGKTDRD